MTSLTDVLAYLEYVAPLSLAESWDNVGLLWGPVTIDEISRIMTCLTLTPDVAEEAISEKVNLIVTHHPILFRGTKSVTSKTIEGDMLLKIAQAGISIYAPHTAYDNSKIGINQQLAETLELLDIQPLKSDQSSHKTLGTGRTGALPKALKISECMDFIKARLKLHRIYYTGDPQHKINKIGLVCGSGGEYLQEAIHQGCDLFLTGEANLHHQLLARHSGVSLVLIGHYESERPGIIQLANILAEQFRHLDCFASRVEHPPLLTSE